MSTDIQTHHPGIRQAVGLLGVALLISLAIGISIGIIADMGLTHRQFKTQPIQALHPVEPPFSEEADASGIES